MSTWLEQFAANIDAIKAKGNNPQASGLDAANRLMDMPESNGGIPGSNVNPYGQSSGGKNALLSGGQKLLDLISRPMEAVANTADYEVNDLKDIFGKDSTPDSPGKTAGDRLGGYFGAFADGLSGKDKTTYSKVLGDMGVTNPIVKGVGGFIGDVALDPLMYVGAGEIGAGLKLGAKAIGKGDELAAFGSKIKGFGRATNDTTKEGLGISADEGATKAVADTPATPAKTPYAINNEGKPALALEGKKFVADTSGNIDNPTWGGNADELFAQTHLNAKTAARDSVLKGVESTPYKDAEIGALYREHTPQVEQKYTENVTTKASPTAVTDAVNKKIAEVSNGAGVPIVGRSGGSLNWKTNTPAQALRNTTDAAHLMPAEVLHQLVLNPEKIPKNMANMFIKIDAKTRVPIKAWAMDAHLGIASAGDDVIKAVEKTRIVDGAIEKTPLSPMERMIWAINHEKIIGKKNVTYILQGGMGATTKSAASIATRTAVVRAQKELTDYKNIAALQAARKSGAVTKVGDFAIKERLVASGNKFLPDYERSIAYAEKMLATAKAAPTERNMALVQAANAEVKRAALDKLGRSKPVTEAMSNSPEFQGIVRDNVDNVVGKGDVSAFERGSNTLSLPQHEGVQAALKHMHQKNFVDPLNPKLFPHITPTGAYRDSQRLGEGKGVYRNANRGAQLDIAKSLLDSANKIVGKGWDDLSRPAAMYDAYMPMLRGVEDTLREQGIPLILGTKAGGFPMSAYDYLSTLDRGFVEKNFFSPKQAMNPTDLIDIGEIYTRKGLGQYGAANEARLAVADLLNPKSVINQGRNANTYSPMSQIIKAAGTADNSSAKAMAFATTIDHALGNEATMKSLMEILGRNQAAAIVKGVDQSKHLSEEVISNLTRYLDDPATSAAKRLELATTARQQVAEAARKKGGNIDPAAVNRAQDTVTTHLAQSMPLAGMSAVAKGAEGYARATTNAERAANGVKIAESGDIIGHNFATELFGDALDIGKDMEVRAGVKWLSAIAPHLGVETLRPILLRNASVAQSESTRFVKILGKIVGQYPEADQLEAWHMLQAGTDSTNAATIDMRLAMQEMFNLDGEASKFGFLERNGITADAMRPKLKKMGFPDHFELNAGNLGESWKTWNTTNPLEDMAKFHAAANSAIADAQMGAEISKFGENVWKPGLVKIIDRDGKSLLATLIDTSKYYPDDIARQMHMLDKTLKELAAPNKSNSFLKLLDSATHSYKAGLTIYNPNHHIRNMVGDMWLSSMDGVKMSAYKRATAVLRTAPSQYKDFDSLRAFEDAYKLAPGGNGPKTIMTIMINGKATSFTPDQVYKMAFKSSVLKSYDIIEDTSKAAGEADAVAHGLKTISPFNGKIHNVAAATSEYREHYIRIAHFIHALEDGTKSGIKFDAKDPQGFENALKKVSDIAAGRVNKWHPDGSDMSQFEKKGLRRAILFYSWVRKAVPLVVEASVMRPGKVLQYNKGLYNYAQTQGIDLKGYGNPFPTDQLFPSYIQDSVQGPLWGHTGSYMGIKPGVPSVDIADQYFNSPKVTLQTIMGSTNPIIKAPFEAATGSNAATGAPVMDWTDYIDNQIPEGGRIDALAGNRSLSSGFTQPNYVAKTNVGYTGNDSAGMSPGWMKFFNWISGVSATDYSKPSAAVSAQRENKVVGRP